MNALMHTVLGTGGASTEGSAMLSLKEAHVPEVSGRGVHPSC